MGKEIIIKITTKTMTSPANPGVKGVSEVEHDGRPDSAHETEVRKAECNKENQEESNPDQDVSEK